MNTTRKGDAFEEKVFSYYQTQIIDDLFWARKECCQVFHKKGYYSKDREKDIFFDVSIEITLPGQTDYALLVLIECKNYAAKPVPVDDLEEFWSKIQQISGAKGIVASTASFQEGALNFAKSKHIGLLRFFSDNSIKVLLNRIPSTFGSSNHNVPKNSLCDESFTSPYYHCCGSVDGIFTCSTNRMLEQLLKNNIDRLSSRDFTELHNPQKSPQVFVQFKSKAEIENLANTALEQIEYAGGIVDLDGICAWQQQESGLIVKTDETSPFSESVLGTLSFAPPLITIFQKSGSRRERRRFTLAHEIGHFVLGNKDYMLQEHTSEADFDPLITTSLANLDLKRMEWQANYFASCLLLPRAALQTELSSIASQFNLRDRGFGLIYIDDQPINFHNYYRVTNRLTIIFRASRQAITLRLQELGYLTDDRHKFKSLKGLFEHEI